MRGQLNSGLAIRRQGTLTAREGGSDGRSWEGGCTWDSDQPQLSYAPERRGPCVHLVVCVGVCGCMCTCSSARVGDSAWEPVTGRACVTTRPFLLLCGPGVSSSMSFEEEEEDEDENSSSSSQLNSNTRPSSATSRKSIRVSTELPAQQRGRRQCHPAGRGMSVK